MKIKEIRWTRTIISFKKNICKKYNQIKKNKFVYLFEKLYEKNDKKH